MIVTYLGHSALKIQYGDFTLAYNPLSGKAEGLPAQAGKAPRFGSDVVLISTNIAECNGAENMSYGDREPFVIKGPGEYEITGLTVNGYGMETVLDGENYINTVYKMVLDGMSLLFIGMANDTSLTPEFRGKIGTADIIFLPVGYDGLTNAMAYKLAVGTDAGIIVPLPKDESSLKSFLKEAGAEKTSPIDKLTIKKKDLAGKEGEVVVLSQ